MSDANPVDLEHGTCANTAAGFALGRQDRNPPSRFASEKRYKTRNRTHAAPAPGRRSALPGTPSRTMPPLAFDEPAPEKTAPDPQPIIDTPGTLNTVPCRQQSTKGSLRGSVRARLRRQTNEDSSSRKSRDGSVSVDSSRPGTAQRPSSSWLQRISTISSPRNGSSRSSSCPDSPSMSGSTAQMLPSSAPISPAVEPNKLVKRSTSQRVLSSGNPTRSLGRSPTTPGLRRPATSHQRASTPSYHRERYPPDLANPPPNDLPPIETSATSTIFRDDTWHPYFTSYHRATTHKYHRRRANSISPNGEYVRQLTVEPGNLPTLLLATSITPEPREFPSDTTKRVPVTRRTSDMPDNPPPFEPPSKEHQNQKLPRYKNRAATNSSATRNPPEAEPYRRNRGFSLSHGKARNMSSHLQSLQTSKTERIPPPSSGLRRRRNITDPTVFQRPMTSSQDEFYLAQAGSIGKKPSPTLPPLPRPFELGVDIPGDSTPWHATSLAGSRSAFQHQRHPNQGSNNSPPVSHPRPKRFSTTASDPASTLIGSDNDMKVFTSGDEDETDFQSDTAYDSFPSRAMRSSDSVPRGPRIETIFDQPAPQLTKSKLAALEQSTPTGPLSEGMCPNSPNAPRYGNIHGMASTSGAAEASQPPASGNTPAGGATYKLPYNTFTKEKSRQPPIAKKHIPPPDRDIDSGKLSDQGSKHSLFDWSEQHKSEKDSQGSAYRPRTVHGKNEAEARATRTLTRRGPSVLHLRSQSVPVSRDPNTINESHYPSAKFGTWGLGNKGVSEDWDGDFEFEESDELPSLDAGRDAKPAPPSLGMRVPQAIMERQASVHGQFGHVKELTLLVEELRRLRLQAKELHIIDGPSIDLWKEAEGIINLATLDDDESSFNLSKSPPSPTMNIDWCDDESPTTKNPKGQRNRDSGPDCSPLSIKTNGSQSTSPPDRARSSSTTKAQSVLDTIYQQRKVQDPVQPEAKAPQQRLPFDTQSLRDLVVRAGVVTRALKDIVRRAQGVSTDSDNVIMPQDPPFSQIFTHPSGNSSVPQRSDLPNGKVGNGHRGDAPPGVDNEGDVSARMKMMTVV